MLRALTLGVLVTALAALAGCSGESTPAADVSGAGLVGQSATASPTRTPTVAPTPTATLTPTPTPSPTPTPAPALTPSPSPTPLPPTPRPPARPPANGVAYANCTEARAAGAAPVRVGQPGYGTHLDRDRDGIGCE